MKILSSENRVSLDKIQSAIKQGQAFANIVDIALDKDYVEKYRHDWCWLNYNQTPNEVGWYKVNREKGVLEKITEQDAKSLQWHERLFIYESALKAVNEKIPLALYIGDEYNDARLSALYLCGPDYLAWVAVK